MSGAKKAISYKVQQEGQSSPFAEKNMAIIIIAIGINLVISSASFSSASSPSASIWSIRQHNSRQHHRHQHQVGHFVSIILVSIIAISINWVILRTFWNGERPNGFQCSNRVSASASTSAFTFTSSSSSFMFGAVHMLKQSSMPRLAGFTYVRTSSGY